MKKAILMILFLSAVSMVFAQVTGESIGASGVAEEIEASAGITPDSPLYGLDRAWDRITLALTFGKSAKSEKGLRLAQERLMEVKEMIEQNKLEHAERAQAEHRNAIETAEGFLEEIEDNGEESKEAMGKVAGIQNRVESHYEKVAEVKDTILERQSERMSEDQITHLEAVFNSIKEKAQEMEQKAEQKKEQAKNKYKEQTGKSDEEVDAEEEAIDEETGLSAGRKVRAEKAIQRAESALEKAREEIREEKVKGTDVSDIEEILEEAEAQVENAKGAVGAGKAKNGRDIAEGLKEFGNEVSEIANQLREARAAGNFEEVLEQKRETIRQRHIDHLNDVLEKVPEQARESVQQAIENAERARERAEEKQQERKEEQEQEKGIEGEEQEKEKGPGEETEEQEGARPDEAGQGKDTEKGKKPEDAG